MLMPRDQHQLGISILTRAQFPLFPGSTDQMYSSYQNKEQYLTSSSLPTNNFGSQMALNA